MNINFSTPCLILLHDQKTGITRLIYPNGDSQVVTCNEFIAIQHAWVEARLQQNWEKINKNWETIHRAWN